MTGYGYGDGRAPRRTPVAAALGCLLALAFAATACSSGDGGPPGPDDHKEQGTQGPIVVASGLDVTGSGGVRQQLIDEWNRDHAGSRSAQAVLVELPGGADLQRSQLLGALQSGSAHYDVVNLDITWIPEFAEAGLIGPLPEKGPEDRDFIKQVRETTLWKGRSYARPFNTDVGLLYYRTDLLKAAEVEPDRMPADTWTWDNMYDSISTLQSSPAHRKGQSGWTSQLDDYEGLTVNTIEAFASVGVELTDSEGKYTATKESLKRGLDELLRRTDNDRLLPAALHSDETATLTDFAAGRAAYLRHWPYAYGALRELLPPEAYAVTQLPGAAVLGGQNLAVSADSSRAEQARDLITFLTSPESERCLLDAGFAATRAAAYGATAQPCWPRVAAALRPAGGAPKAATTAATGAAPSASPAGEGAGNEQGEAQRAAYTRTLRAALTEAVQRPRTPYYGAFTRVVQAQVPELLNDRTPDSEKAAATLDSALRNAFAGK